MSEGLNKAMLIGNLGQEPELKVTAGGQAVLKLRLATTERYMDRNKEAQERTDWHDVTVWGARAEALGKILRKGERIFVEGRIQTSSYEKEGEKRYRTEIVATNVLLNGTPATSDAPRAARPARAADPFDAGQDDIPF